MLTQFLVNPNIFGYLEENKEEQRHFIRKAHTYWMTYAVDKPVLIKKDNVDEFI